MKSIEKHALLQARRLPAALLGSIRHRSSSGGRHAAEPGVARTSQSGDTRDGPNHAGVAARKRDASPDDSAGGQYPPGNDLSPLQRSDSPSRGAPSYRINLLYGGVALPIPVSRSHLWLQV